MMKQGGFGYLLDNCINFENHKTTEGKVIIRLKGPGATYVRVGAQEQSLSMLEPAVRERIIV